MFLVLSFVCDGSGVLVLFFGGAVVVSTAASESVTNRCLGFEGGDLRRGIV